MGQDAAGSATRGEKETVTSGSPLWLSLPLVAGLAVSAQAGAPIDFDTEIVPVLTHAGCNAGACHGAAIGRGGFKLSLYGSDPASDYRSVVLDWEGRRVNLAQADESLLFLKSTESIAHGGGARLDLDGPGATRLLKWIRAGAPRLQKRRLVDFSVAPASSLLEQPQATVTLTATAVFDDGTRSDVTRWTVFHSEDSSAVSIAGHRVRRRAAATGRHIVTARFLDRVVPLEFLVPRDAPRVQLPPQSQANFIDKHIHRRLEQLRLPPSTQTDDATFLRRVYLDLAGRLPESTQVRAFLADRHPEKRRQLVDQLLESPEFVENWTLILARLLRIQSQPNDQQGARTFHNWLKTQLEQRARYDRMAWQLLTAQGDTHASGPPNFFRVVNGAREQAEYVSELFLGVRLRCANCHNHPLDHWTQDDYHGLAAVFARIERGRIIRPLDRGEVTHPRTGQPAQPRIPGAHFLQTAGDQRAALADWLIADGNPYFARALVNRLWKQLMGRGLVSPTDDLRTTNPATHPALLQALADDFIRSGFDIRHSLRTIASSAAYARDSRPTKANASDDRFYSHALVRPLDPEVLVDALSDVTSVPEIFGDLPAGSRAVSLFDPKTPSTALDILGRCSRASSCESLSSGPSGLARTLHLINGKLINDKLGAPQGFLRQFLNSPNTDSQLIEELYLRSLCRLPMEQERQYWLSELGTADTGSERRQIAEDFMWSLLSCREFLTNH